MPWATIAQLLLAFLEAIGLVVKAESNASIEAAGAAKVSNQINATTIEKQREMANAQARAPQSRGDLAARLSTEADRDGELPVVQGRAAGSQAPGG